LAGINGTILAIVVAASLGYVLIVFQSLDALVTRYIERANRANDLLFRMQFASMGFDAAKLSNDDLDMALFCLATGAPNEDLGLPDPSDLAARGAVLAVLLPRAATTAPFVGFGGGSLSLNDEASVRDWRPKFDNARRLLAASRQLQEDVGRFRELAAAADEKMKADSGGLWASEPHKKVVAEFEQFLDRAAEISQDAAADELALDLYRKRLPARRVVAAAAAVLFAAFIGGVAIPMVHPAVSTVIAAWLPATIYSVCLAFAAAHLLRHYVERQ
jgi:hypothetical protein